MPRRTPPVQWAPRVQPHKIRRLYELDAQGLADEDLIDEIGYALYSRCQSILQVTDAMNGQVHCARCDTIILHTATSLDDVVQCAACGWSTRWGEYYNTYRTQELGAGGAADIFAEFVRAWEQIHTPRSKMLVIDQLIHRWHWETARKRPTFGVGRPTGVNLIEGNKQQVLALLDTLTYGAGSDANLHATKAAWRARRQEAQERQRAGRARHHAPRSDTEEQR